MDETPTTEYLVSRIQDMTTTEATDALKLVRRLPEGKKALTEFQKTLQPKERKKMNDFVNWLLTPLDFIQDCLSDGINRFAGRGCTWLR